MFEWKVENGNMTSASCKGREITKWGLVLGVSMTKWNVLESYGTCNQNCKHKMQRTKGQEGL